MSKRRLDAVDRADERSGARKRQRTHETVVDGMALLVREDIIYRYLHGAAAIAFSLTCKTHHKKLEPRLAAQDPLDRTKTYIGWVFGRGSTDLLSTLNGNYTCTEIAYEAWDKFLVCVSPDADYVAYALGERRGAILPDVYPMKYGDAHYGMILGRVCSSSSDYNDAIVRQAISKGALDFSREVHYVWNLNNMVEGLFALPADAAAFDGIRAALNIWKKSFAEKQPDSFIWIVTNTHYLDATFDMFTTSLTADHMPTLRYFYASIHDLPHFRQRLLALNLRLTAELYAEFHPVTYSVLEDAVRKNQLNNLNVLTRHAPPQFRSRLGKQFAPEVDTLAPGIARMVRAFGKQKD